MKYDQYNLIYHFRPPADRQGGRIGRSPGPPAFRAPDGAFLSFETNSVNNWENYSSGLYCFLFLLVGVVVCRYINYEIKRHEGGRKSGEEEESTGANGSSADSVTPRSAGEEIWTIRKV